MLGSSGLGWNWPAMPQDSPGSGSAKSHGFKAHVGAGPGSPAETAALLRTCVCAETRVPSGHRRGCCHPSALRDAGREEKGKEGRRSLMNTFCVPGTSPASAHGVLSSAAGIADAPLGGGDRLREAWGRSARRCVSHRTLKNPGGRREQTAGGWVEIQASSPCSSTGPYRSLRRGLGASLTQPTLLQARLRSGARGVTFMLQF